MLKEFEVTCDSDIITPTCIKPIKGAIQVQTQLTCIWAPASTGLLVMLINAEQFPRRAPAARPAARVPCDIPP